MRSKDLKANEIKFVSQMQFEWNEIVASPHKKDRNGHQLNFCRTISIVYMQNDFYLHTKQHSQCPQNLTVHLECCFGMVKHTIFSASL